MSDEVEEMMRSELDSDDPQSGSRRWFLRVGVGSLLQGAALPLLWRRQRKRVDSFTFEPPFERGKEIHFPARRSTRLPIDPAFIQVGANDVAVWCFPKRPDSNPPQDLSITLLVEDRDGRIVRRSERSADVEWDDDSAFDGINVRFHVPAKALSEVRRLIIEFRYPIG